MKQRSYYPWLMVVLCCGVAGSSIGVYTNAAGVFYTPAAETLGVGRGAFATQATLSMLAAGLSTPLVGILLKKLPLRPLLGAGVAAASLCTVLMAMSQELWQFYLLGIVRGLGIALFALLPVTEIIGNWFQKRNGLAMGLALSFSGLSGAICNPILTMCIESWGWRTAYIISMLLALGLALPGVLFLRLTPQEVGMLPYGSEESKLIPDEKKTEKDTAQGKHKELLSVPFITMAILVVLLTSVTSIGQHFPGYAGSVGLGAEIGAVMVSAGMIGNILSKLLLGVLSDRLGPFRACGIMTGINMTALICLPFVPAGAQILALTIAFFFGAIYSVSGVGFPLLARSVFGMERYVSVYSVLSVLLNVGAAVAMTLGGVVYDVTGSYTPAFFGGAGFQLICIFLIAGLSVFAKRRDKKLG